MPKGYASLYAPAIDSGRYNFIIEVVKTEPDPERPILIVKITADFNSLSEDDVENSILQFVQNIVNGYSQRKIEYLNFIYSETVNFNDLTTALNRVRLIYRLYTVSEEIIKKYSIEQTSSDFKPFTKQSLIRNINKLQADISDVLKKIQKAYNESLDIDDEEEYYRVQSNIREKRKKFRMFDELCTSYCNAVDSYAPIEANSSSPIEVKTENAQEVTAPQMPVEKISKPEEKEEPVITQSQQLTERDFENWLVSKGGVSETTAKQYISNIHSIEKLYQTLFGVRKNLLGAESADDAKVIIDALVERNEYMYANERRHNSFSAALSKFAQFADISIDGIKTAPEKRSIHTPISSQPYILEKVDFANPKECRYYKPTSFKFNGFEYHADNWIDLYAKFLILLYTDNVYSWVLKDNLGKSLYGRCIDFADKALMHYLRRPIRVSTDFFAEGNLSASDIVKHIKAIMDLCSINSNQMIIEYNTLDKSNENSPADDTIIESPEVCEQPIIEQPAIEQPAITNEISERDENSVVSVEQTESDPIPDTYETSLEPQRVLTSAASFKPDLTKPFELKTAVIEILSSSAPEINKYRGHKDGISSSDLRELLREYYGKTIGDFEISMLLMMDRAFQSVGKRCYVLNTAAIPQKAVSSEQEFPMNSTPDNEPIEKREAEELHTTEQSPEEQHKFDDSSAPYAETDLMNSIIDVIKQNSGNLQYIDGFGAYEVKTILANRGIFNATENEIEALMSECDSLTEIEEGYYILANMTNDVIRETVKEEHTEHSETLEKAGTVEKISTDDNVSSESRNIELILNGRTVSAYDYSDALNKICEFAINFSPFRMARIAGQGIQLNGNNVFYRKAVPVNGYNKLSNGLQVIKINSLSDLKTIMEEVKRYCQIDDGMITITGETQNKNASNTEFMIEI